MWAKWLTGLFVIIAWALPNFLAVLGERDFTYTNIEGEKVPIYTSIPKEYAEVNGGIVRIDPRFLQLQKADLAWENLRLCILTFVILALLAVDEFVQWRRTKASIEELIAACPPSKPTPPPEGSPVPAPTGKPTPSAVEHETRAEEEGT